MRSTVLAVLLPNNDPLQRRMTAEFRSKDERLQRSPALGDMR